MIEKIEKIMLGLIFVVLIVMGCFVTYIDSKDTAECKDICLENDYDYHKVEKRVCLCLSEEHNIKYFNLNGREKEK